MTGDEVNGPFHSNDDILVSGSPSFGKGGGSDRVEISGTGYRPTTAAPRFNPALITGAAQLDPPATNKSLEAVADPGYRFTGQTTIVANDQHAQGDQPERERRRHDHDGVAAERRDLRGQRDLRASATTRPSGTASPPAVATRGSRASTRRT